MTIIDALRDKDLFGHLPRFRDLGGNIALDLTTFHQIIGIHDQ